MQSLILKSCFGIRRKNWGFNYCRKGKYTILPLAAITPGRNFISHFTIAATHFSLLMRNNLYLVNTDSH